MVASMTTNCRIPTVNVLVKPGESVDCAVQISELPETGWCVKIGGVTARAGHDRSISLR
jgi:hypothetical protein